MGHGAIYGGGEVNPLGGLIVLPPWPEGFDMMEVLARGVYIKHHKKDDVWEIRVDKAPVKAP